MNQLGLARADAELFVPDDADVSTALERTTDLGVGAHPDDLEFMCLAPIGQCLDDDERWFTGVTCTDGAAAARGGRFAALSDDELVACMRFFAERMKIVVEPTGCLGFAAARKMKDRLEGKRIGILVSGGNIDLPRFASLMA